MKNNTNNSEIPALLQATLQILEAHRQVFRQARPYWRAVGLFFGELFTFGRHTLTQSLLALGITEGIGAPGIAYSAGHGSRKTN